MGIFGAKKPHFTAPIIFDLFYASSLQAIDTFTAWHKSALQTKDFSQIDLMIRKLEEPSVMWLEVWNKDRGWISLITAMEPRGSVGDKKLALANKGKFEGPKRLLNECYEEALGIKIKMMQESSLQEGLSPFEREYELLNFLAERRNNWAYGFPIEVPVTGHFHTKEDWENLQNLAKTNALTKEFYSDFRKVLRERAQAFNAKLDAEKSDIQRSYSFPGEDK